MYCCGNANAVTKLFNRVVRGHFQQSHALAATAHLHSPIDIRFEQTDPNVQLKKLRLPLPQTRRTSTHRRSLLYAIAASVPSSFGP
jgi:hypothetical protein